MRALSRIDGQRGAEDDCLEGGLGRIVCVDDQANLATGSNMTDS